MRISRKGAGAIALGLGVAFAASACAGGAGAADAPTTPDTQAPAAQAPAAPAADGGAAEVYVPSIIAPENRVGAMENFAFGDTFRATQPISLDLLYRIHPGYPVLEDWLVWQAFSDNQNVTFNRTDVLMADWDARRNLLIATGDFPTMVPVVWPGQESQWVTGGALLPVSDFFDYMPHFQHYVAEWDMARELENRRSEDGNIYLLPGFRESPIAGSSFMINADIWEAAGVTSDPETFEELAAALRAVQATGLVDFAFSDRWTDNNPLGGAFNFVGPNFNTQGGWALSTVRWSPDNEAFIGTAMADEYRNMIEFFAGLVADGVMNPDITQDDDSAIQQFITGRSAMMSSDFAQMNVVRNAAEEAGFDHNFRMIAVPDGTHNFLAGNRVGPGFVLNANAADSPYFLATLQFLDWILYSHEGREFAQWGVRGTTFDIDANGDRFYLGNIGGAGRVWGDIAPEDRLPLNATFGFQDGVWMNTWGGSNELAQSVMPVEEREYVATMVARKQPLPLSPAAPLTEMESEEVGMLSANINDMVHAATAQFILGIRPMSEWDSFREQLRSAGVDRVVEIHNAALARTR